MPDGAAADAAGDPAARAAESAARVAATVESLRGAPAGSDARRDGVAALLGVLSAADAAPAAQRRPVLSAFVDADGPRVLYELESMMDGDWRTDAKNGTLSRVSAIAALAGPVGLTLRRYRAMRDTAVNAAAANLKCGQEH